MYSHFGRLFIFHLFIFHVFNVCIQVKCIQIYIKQYSEVYLTFLYSGSIFIMIKDDPFI